MSHPSRATGIRCQWWWDVTAAPNDGEGDGPSASGALPCAARIVAQGDRRFEHLSDAERQEVVRAVIDRVQSGKGRTVEIHA